MYCVIDYEINNNVDNKCSAMGVQKRYQSILEQIHKLLMFIPFGGAGLSHTNVQKEQFRTIGVENGV
jgi:hypothetical protein